MADPKAYDVHGKRILQVETGKYIAADDKLAADLIANGLEGQAVSAVSPEQWTAERQRREADTFKGQAESVARGAGEAIGDVMHLGAQLSPMGFLGGYEALGEHIGIDPTSNTKGVPAQISEFLGGQTAEEYDAQNKLLKSVNPTAYGGGELAGNVALGLATGGVSMAAGKTIGGAILKTGVKEGVARALGTGAAMAVEGGVYGAAQTEGEARRAGQTEGATAEQLLQGIGLSALLAGGLGVAGSGLSTAFRKLVSKADDIIPRAGIAAEGDDIAKAAFGAGSKEAGEDAVAKLQSNLTGANYDTVSKYGAHRFDAEAVEGRNLWKNRQQNIEAAVPKMTSALDELDQAIDEISVNVKKVALKKEGVESMLDGVDQVAAKRTGMDRIRATMTSANEVLDTIPKDDPAMGVLSKRLGRYVDYINNHLDGLKADGQTAADVYVISDLIKREAQHAEKAITTTMTRSTDGSVVEAARKLKEAFENKVQEPLRQSLEDVSTWGKAGTAQKEINAKWKPFIDNNSRYNKELTTTDGNQLWADGRTKYYADTSKVQSWIEGIGTARSQTAQEAVRGRITAAKELIDTIAKYHPLDNAQMERLGLAERAFKDVQESLGKLDKTMTIANKIEDVMQAERNAGALYNPLSSGIIGSAVGRIVNTISGTIQAGPMGGALGFAGLMAKPGSAMAAADQLAGLASRIGMKLDGKASNWVKASAGLGPVKKVVSSVSKAAKATAEPTRKVIVPASVSLFQGRDKSLEDAYDRRTNQLIRASQDPEYLIDQMSRTTGGLASIDPALAGALVEKTANAVEYLRGKAPAGTLDPTALMPGRKSVVSKLEMQRFARVWAAVEKPMTVLDDLQKGIATPDQIDALKVVHPETYQAIRMSVMDAIVEVARKGGRIPIATRQQLDMLLDLGGAGEPAFAPAISDRIAKLQNAKGQPKVPRAPKAPKLAASMQLPQQNWPSA